MAVLGLGLLFAACNNDDDVPDITPKETKLAADTWAVTGVTVSDSVMTDSSIYQPCMEDDKLDFATNHDFDFSDDSTSCDSISLLPYGQGLWAFNFEEDSIALKYSDTTLHWEISALTDSTLQVSYPDSLGSKLVTKTLSFEPASGD